MKLTDRILTIWHDGDEWIAAVNDAPAGQVATKDSTLRIVGTGQTPVSAVIAAEITLRGTAL